MALAFAYVIIKHSVVVTCFTLHKSMVWNDKTLIYKVDDKWVCPFTISCTIEQSRFQDSGKCLGPD